MSTANPLTLPTVPPQRKGACLPNPSSSLGEAALACCPDIHHEPQRLQWSRIFFALLVPALVSKFAMVAEDAAQRSDSEWLVQLFGRAALFLWGGELLSAFALSLFALGVIVWVSRLGFPKGARRLIDVILIAHAIFCGLGFAYFAEEGDFATWELFSLVSSQGEGTHLWTSVASAFDRVAALVLVVCLAACRWGFAGLGPRFWRASPRSIRVFLGLFALEASLRVFAVPAMVAGHAPFRFKSHGLERTALIELASSGMRPLFGDLASGRHAHVKHARWAPPPSESPNEPAWSVQRRKTDVVVLILESVSTPIALDAYHPMPFTESLLKRPDVLHLASHYANYSLTTKSVFSILSGELPDPGYAAAIGRHPKLEVDTLPDVLRDQGYGTWFLSSQDLSFDRQSSFYARRGFDFIEDGEALATESTWRGGWGVDDARTIERGLEVLDAQAEAGAPSFVAMQMQAAHHPYIIPGGNDLGERSDKYRKALGYVDERVEQLVRGLEARGRLDNTLLLVVSDHGEGWGEYRGRNVAEPNILALTFMMGPQLATLDAHVSESTTTHIDLAPTLLGLLGLSPSCTMVGRDLSLGGEVPIALFAGRPPRSQRGLRDGRWKFVLEDGEPQLFDLHADPQNRVDLATMESPRVRRYTHLLEDWSAHMRWRFANYTQVRKGRACVLR